MTARDYPIQDDSDTESSTEWAQWWLQSNVTMDTTTMVVAANDNDDFWFSSSPLEDIFTERIGPIPPMHKHHGARYENPKISSNEIWISPIPQEGIFAECVAPIAAENGYHYAHIAKHDNPKRTFNGENQFGHPMRQIRDPTKTMDTRAQVNLQNEASEVSDDSKHGINAVANVEHGGSEYALENKIPRNINMVYSSQNHAMRADPKPNLCAKSRTSYNFFFNHERHRVLQYLLQTQQETATNAHSMSKFPLEDFFVKSLRYYSDRTIWTNNNVPLQDLILQQHWNQNRNSKRKRNKSEKDGIPYREMRQHISKVWRLLPGNAKDVFSLIAVKDLQHSLLERRNPTK
jgi:hypothetical protein